MTLVQFDRATVEFDGAPVLREISLELSERRVGIIGSNGSGKSTLARLINGLVTASSGTVTVDGQDVASHGQAVRRKVGFIFTDPDSQIIMPTVREDVAFSLRRLRLPAAKRDARVDAALERFGLADLAERPAHRLSGGQKQLLALAAILVAEPELVVADEPTTLLDARNATRLAREFAELGQSIYLVTHQLETVADFDRVIVLDEGLVVADDEPASAVGFYRRLMARL